MHAWIGKETKVKFDVQVKNTMELTAFRRALELRHPSFFVGPVAWEQPCYGGGSKT